MERPVLYPFTAAETVMRVSDAQAISGLLAALRANDRRQVSILAELLEHRMGAHTRHLLATRYAEATKQKEKSHGDVSKLPGDHPLPQDGRGQADPGERGGLPTERHEVRSSEAHGALRNVPGSEEASPAAVEVSALPGYIDRSPPSRFKVDFGDGEVREETGHPVEHRRQ